MCTVARRLCSSAGTNWIGGSGVRDLAIICGPTAAGKSAIAMSLAERSGAMLISADSRQVYRGFDIGTAKPSPADLRRVEHRGISIVDPTHQYSASQWSDSAMSWLDDAAAKGVPVIIVGGTGFYLRALESPLFESPPLDPDDRRAVLSRLAPLSTETLRERCAEIDPERAHLGRTQLLRALEMHAITGRSLSCWLEERARPAQVRGHYLVVDPGAPLRERIADRVGEMLRLGWEQEIEQLVGTVPADAPAWNACGYGLLRDALAGQMSRSDAIERTIVETRQYAKRQRTWFRHQLPSDRVTGLDPSSADALSRATAWLDSATLSESL
jgi:tRNA dimethylallyltransferase